VGHRNSSIGGDSEVSQESRKTSRVVGRWSRSRAAGRQIKKTWLDQKPGSSMESQIRFRVRRFAEKMLST